MQPIVPSGLIRIAASDCELPLWGLGLREGRESVERLAGDGIEVELLVSPELGDVTPEDVQNPTDLVQLLGRAVMSCQRLQNQQHGMKCAHHLCFGLIVHVVLCLPLQRGWYAGKQWRLETLHFALSTVDRNNFASKLERTMIKLTWKFFQNMQKSENSEP